MMRFEIGQNVYWATYNTCENYVVCPDCGGTGRLRVIFHDDTIVSIGCGNCSLGYNPPTGRIKVFDRVAEVRIVKITGVEITDKETRWRTDSCYLVDDDNLFETREAALIRAHQLAEDADRNERERIKNKEKDTRSWAWNASYHRREIERAKKSIEYHSAKLAVAAIKAKIDKKAAG